MANAQVLILVRSAASMPPDQIRAIVEAASRASGFTPGPWSYDSQFVNIMPGTTPDTTGTPVPAAVVRGGPWDGLSWSTAGLAPVPPAGVRVAFNAFRQNLLNGPADPGTGNWPFGTAGVDAALAALGAVVVRRAFRGPSNAIRWDRSIPAPIALAASGGPPAGGGSSGAGWALGILAIAGAAWAYARSSEKTAPVRSGLSPTSYGPAMAGLSAARYRTREEHAQAAREVLHRAARYRDHTERVDAFELAYEHASKAHDPQLQIRAWRELEAARNARPSYGDFR